jgi:ADP-ribose pyrophosphatase YjhB (NUDIX family)
MITCTFENGNIASPGLRHVTVNAIVLKDGKVLLGLRKAVPGLTMLETGKWALIGGFFDHGENLVQAVRREVMEESGWEIDNISLFRINDKPDRPKEDRQNVDMIFTCNAVKQVGSHDKEVMIRKSKSLNGSRLMHSRQLKISHLIMARIYSCISNISDILKNCRY